MTASDFKNSTVLITGASSGIGKEFAKNLASKGAKLVISARSHTDLINLANELEAKHPDIWVKAVTGDLSEVGGAKKLYSHISEMGISIDHLINNAGFGKFCEFSNERNETYQNMLLLNINALVELTHLCLPSMKSKNSGGIINVASTASFQPLPYMAVYGASKAFVLSFSEALSGELMDTNVRVMALCPGTTDSGFMKTANGDTSKMKLASSTEVVNDALKAYSKNRIFVVSGTINYLTSLIPRIVSRKRAVKIVAKMLKGNILTRTAD